MKKLRRKDRAISKEKAKTLLENAEYGILSVASDKGEPYGVPLNFCIIDNRIYFHSAIEGHKINCIEQNKSVSFCVVGKTEILPDKFSTAYESVVVFGEATEVFNESKQIALEGLVRKYSSNFIAKGIKYIDASKEKTRVFKIDIKKITGKAREK